MKPWSTMLDDARGMTPPVTKGQLRARLGGGDHRRLELVLLALPVKQGVQPPSRKAELPPDLAQLIRDPLAEVGSPDADDGAPVPHRDHARMLATSVYSGIVQCLAESRRLGGEQLHALAAHHHQQSTALREQLSHGETQRAEQLARLPMLETQLADARTSLATTNVELEAVRVLRSDAGHAAAMQAAELCAVRAAAHANAPLFRDVASNLTTRTPISVARTNGTAKATTRRALAPADSASTAPSRRPSRQRSPRRTEG